MSNSTSSAKGKRKLKTNDDDINKVVANYETVFAENLKVRLNFIIVNSKDSRQALVGRCNDSTTINDDFKPEVVILPLENVFEQALSAEATLYALHVLQNKAVYVHSLCNNGEKETEKELLYCSKQIWNDQDHEFNSIVSDLVRKAAQLGFTIHNFSLMSMDSYSSSTIVYFIMPSGDGSDKVASKRNDSISISRGI